MSFSQRWKIRLHILAVLTQEKGQALSEYSVTMMFILIVTIAAITAAGKGILWLIETAATSMTGL